MSKKSSILFQITLFFVTIFFIINVIIVIQFLVDDNNNKFIHMKRYFDSRRIVDEGRESGLPENIINKRLESFYTKISDIDLETLEELAVKTEFDKGPVVVFMFKGKKYIHLRPPKFRDNKMRFDRGFGLGMKPLVLIDSLTEEKIQYFWLFVLSSIDLLLAWFYYFIYKKLKPLINLKNEITKFSNGNLNVNTETIGKDEISQVSNEFNNAIIKIRELYDSRQLFLRNILHELKTPITKGKLISDTLEQSRKKEILQKAFTRLEYLLGEFVKIEELTSGKINLSKKEYRVVDLLDQALDILLIDKSKVDIYPNGTKIYADYEIFSIAIKNLIDNAIRYNTNGKPEIFVKKDSLLIKNKGEPLKRNFEEYLKPFNREYESVDRGLGLGLYITNNVIKRHGFKLFYFHSENYHIFKIQFEVPDE